MFNIDDFGIVRGGGSNYSALVQDRNTSSLTVTIKRGELLKRSTNSAIPILTGDPEIATDILIGLATSESTETASADGAVDVAQILPGTVLRGKPTTASNMNTQALLDGLRFDYVACDVTSLAQTIDEDEGDDPNVHGLCILDGDIVAGTLDVFPHMLATLSGSLVGQIMD